LIDRRTVASILVLGAIALPRQLLRDELVVCPFRRLTGLPCPTCGLTRSWRAAAHLRLRDSLDYHPLGAVTLIGASTLALLGRPGTPGMAGRRDVQLAAGALWVATWLLRLRH
jgi:uncharacterized protein DUF2752